MSLCNDVRLVGFCADAPTFKQTHKGTPMATFVVYTQDYEVDAESTCSQQAHRCVTFGEKAKCILNKVTKGRHIHVRGTLRSKRVNVDGKPQYHTNVLVDEFRVSPRQSVAAVKDVLAELIETHNITHTEQLGLFKQGAEVCGE